MARGRKRKGKITYDSKESMAVYGLITLLLSILVGMSIFISDAPFFTFIKKFFGESVFFLGLFLVNLSLYFFGSKWKMSKVSSLIAQFVFILSLATLLNSFAGQWDAKEIADKGTSGGILGNALRGPLADTFGLGATQVILFFISAIALPISFAMSINDVINMFNTIFQKFSNLIKSSAPDTKDEKLAKAEKIVNEEAPQDDRAQMFGDFQKKEPMVSDDSDLDDTDNEHDSIPVKVTQVSNGEGAIVNNDGLQFPDWQYPPVELLNEFTEFKPPQEDIARNSDIIEQTLNSFNVKAKVVDVLIGPSVTQYALDIALGTKVSKIQNLSNDLALAMAVSANSIRIEAPIAGTSYVGIEVPNSKRQFINFREIIEGKIFQSSRDELPVVVGKDINGDDLVSNIQKMPHLLIAGATGSGKSVVTNTFILSILMKKSPDEVRMIMVDPKQVELSDYNGIPHLLTPVITDMSKVLNALKWAVAEMESRYTLFKDEKVRNIESYNEKMGYSAIPYIVIVIDEMADMMMTGVAEIEGCIVRLAQKARAVGLHLILATQRPSVDVITGILKANIPGRIGLSVATQIDSRVILDQIGAEALLGKGDMLFKEPDKNRPMRIQGVWTSPDEIQRVVRFIKEQVPEVEYTKEVLEGATDPNMPQEARISAQFSDDELFADAARVVVQAGKGSSSLIQRKLSVGYNRAARLLDELQKYGVVGPQRGSKPRDILVSDIESFLAGGITDE